MLFGRKEKSQQPKSFAISPSTPHMSQVRFEVSSKSISSQSEGISGKAELILRNHHRHRTIAKPFCSNALCVRVEKKRERKIRNKKEKVDNFLLERKQQQRSVVNVIYE